MQKILFTFVFLASVAVFGVSASAQKVETEGELFQKISKLTNTKKADDQEKAYKLSKTFLQKFGNGTSNEVKKIKDFVANYERFKLGNLIETDKTAEAFAFGKEILSGNPENSEVTMLLALVGYNALTKKQDKSFGKDSIEYAKTTLKFFGENKIPKDFAPFANQNEATAYMYYIQGSFLIDSNPQESANNFYKSLSFDSKIKEISYPYYIIAYNYNLIFDKLSKDFEAKHGKKTTEDDAMKADNARLEKLLNLLLDSYGKAAKLGEIEKNANAAGWKQRFSQIYAFIKQSETGMNEYYDKILSQPLADPSTF